MSENSEYLQNNRTIIPLTNVDGDKFKTYIGFMLYFIIFVILIPHILIKNNDWNILAAYFPNLDLIATVLGYHGGPMNTFIWKHLYNPMNTTLMGYVSSTLINYIALLGLTYTIAYYTYKYKNIYKGWARAFIMLPMTYFLPSNIIIYIMNMFGKYLNVILQSNSILHYLITCIIGFILVICFILLEALAIENISPYIVNIMNLYTSFI